MTRLADATVPSIPSIPLGTPVWVTLVCAALLYLGVVSPFVIPPIMDRYRKRHGLPAKDEPKTEVAAKVQQLGQDALSPLHAAMKLATTELSRAERRANHAEEQLDAAQTQALHDAATIARLTAELAAAREEAEDSERQVISLTAQMEVLRAQRGAGREGDLIR